MIWPCGDILKGHWTLCGNLRDGCLDVSFEEGDVDDDEVVVEELIGSHSKRIRSFHSSQATPRKVGKAKEYALMVAKAMGKKKLKEMGKAEGKQKVKEGVKEKALKMRKVLGESCKGHLKKRNKWKLEM